MAPGGSIGQSVLILLAVAELIQSGLVLSSFGLGSHVVTRRLSRYTRLEQPDPTMYFRQFEVFFDTLFTPIGRIVAGRLRSPVVSQLSFQLSIGVAVILSASVVYLVTAGLLTGAALVTHQTLGFVINPMPLFRKTIAFVMLCAAAVMFHAGDRAEQLPA